MIVDSELRPNKNYRYSDLGFYIIARIVHRLSGLPLDQYVRQEFYDPLSMSRTTFNPLERIRKEEIVPTEKDDYFRYASLQGNVHDMGAAMLNGVSGHAGLFSDCGDLVKILQMLLNQGYYGGRQYLKEETIKTFTKRHLGSTRRGIGFDMKELQPTSKPNICSFASESAYGHFGFTGTCVWVDPEYKLIYIFLSNRTFPTMTNNLLHQEDYRGKIQEAIYRSFLPGFVQDQS
ncbi:MAG: serine hydrolase [Saprospiraceae bacterium]|nr:serine hydrolase [Saprospiraceae bacterium]